MVHWEGRCATHWLRSFANVTGECRPECTGRSRIRFQGRCSALRNALSLQPRVTLEALGEPGWPDAVDKGQRCISTRDLLRGISDGGTDLRPWFELVLQDRRGPHRTDHYPGWRGCFGCQPGGPCCSGHGECAKGLCLCAAGWAGIDCATPRAALRRGHARGRGGKGVAATPEAPAAATGAAASSSSGLHIYVYEDLPADLALAQFASHMVRR